MAKKSKKSSAKKKLLAVRNDIGIVSSIPFTDSIRGAFESGLGSTLANGNIHDSLGYDPSTLDGAVNALNQQAGITLIVTVGGLTPSLRAACVSTKDFVSIVGSTVNPTLTDSQHFLGGVDLQSAKTNQDRISHMVSNSPHTIGPDDVCLLLNRKSAMAVEELLGWPYNSTSEPATRNIVLVDIDSNTLLSDVQAQFANAFANIGAKGWKVTIISADPFFTQYASTLIPLANQWVAPTGRRICYPLNDYKSKGSPQKHTLHGPILANEFENLGVQVKNKNWTVVPATQLIEDH